MAQVDPRQQAINRLQALIAQPGADPQNKELWLRELAKLAQAPAASAVDFEAGGTPNELAAPAAGSVAFEAAPTEIIDKPGAQLYRATYRTLARGMTPITGIAPAVLDLLEKYAPNVLRGFEAGATAPLRFIGADVTPPRESTLPVRLAETAGSLGSIAGISMLTSAAVPALAAETLLPRTLHAALTLGLTEGGATEPGGNVLKSFAHGALVGAPFGALFAPGLSAVQRMLVGAGLAATFGGPAPVTGTKEEEILLGTALGLLGGGEQKRPTPGEEPRALPPIGEPVQGELFPPEAYTKPGTQLELPGVRAVLEKFTLPKMPLPTEAQIGVQLPLPLEPKQGELSLQPRPEPPPATPNYLPDGRRLGFDPSKGGILVHGTQSPFARIDTYLGKGEIYLTDNFHEAAGYAGGEHLGGGPGQTPIVQSFVAKPGKTIDLNAQVEDIVANGNPEDLDALLDRTRADGYRYATFDHPSFMEGDQIQHVVVALNPKEDLIPSKGFAPSEAPKVVSVADAPLASFGIKEPDQLRNFAVAASRQEPPVMGASVLLPNPAGHPRLQLTGMSSWINEIGVTKYFDEMKKQTAHALPSDLDNYDVFLSSKSMAGKVLNIFARPAGTKNFVKLALEEVAKVQSLPRIAVLDGKTIYPVVPPPVIVSEEPFIYEGYHGSYADLKRFVNKAGGTTHVGTFKAALDRVLETGEMIAESIERIYPVRVELEKPYGTVVGPATDNNANDFALIKELKSRGYDGILYKNTGEDVGSLSLAVFDPEKSIKILGQQILPGMSADMHVLESSYQHHIQQVAKRAFEQTASLEGQALSGAREMLNLDNIVEKVATQIELPLAPNKEAAQAIAELSRPADTSSSPVPRTFDGYVQAGQGFAQLKFEKDGISVVLPDGVNKVKAASLDNIVDAAAELIKKVSGTEGDNAAFADKFRARFKEGLEIFTPTQVSPESSSSPLPNTERFNKAFAYALGKENLRPGEMQEVLKRLSTLKVDLPERFNAPVEVQAPRQLLLNLGETPGQMQLPLVEAEAKAQGMKVSVLPEGYSLKDFEGRVQYFDNLGAVAKAIATTGRDVPDITPPGVPPIGGPPGSHPERPEPGDVPPMPLTDINIGLAPITRYLRPLKAWAEDVEHKSHGLIPAYKIWKLVSRGQLEWLRAELPHIDRGKALVAKLGTQRGRAAYYYLGAQSAAERMHAISAFGITKEEIPLFQQFRKNFDDLFSELAIARFAPYEKDYIPLRGKNANEVDAAYPKHARPSGFDFWADHFRRGDIKVKEDDLFKLYFQYVRAGTKSRYFQPFYKEAQELIDGLTRQGAHTTPGISAVYSRLNLFLDEARNLPDQMKRDLASSADNILRKLGIDADQRQVGHFTDFLLTLNYGANMAFRYSLVLRNMTQNMLVIPIHGPRAWWVGVREAMSEAGKAEAIKAGLSFEPALPYETEALTQFGKLGAIARKGTAAYRHVDEFNRATAYLTAKRVFQREGGRLQRGEISLDQFVKRTNLDSYHPIEKLEILAEARRGNIEGAADLAGQHLHQNTQWIYLRGNEPQMFSGTVGRLLGQYGTWPTWYLEYMKRLVRFGSPTTRVANIARLVATYAAIEFTAQKLFGTDVSSWLYFGPLNYGGGPFLDLAKNAQSLVFGSEADKQIAASRLATFPVQLIPGSGIVREAKKAAEQPDLQKAVFTMLGFPPSDPYAGYLQSPSTTPQSAPGVVDFESGAPKQ